MSKKSNRGKAYFYAMGQRDKHGGILLSGDFLRDRRKKLSAWAHESWYFGYHGF